MNDVLRSEIETLISLVGQAITSIDSHNRKILADTMESMKIVSERIQSHLDEDND